MCGLLPLLHPFPRIQGMRQGGPFLLGLLKEGIDQLNVCMEFPGCAPLSSLCQYLQSTLRVG
jgi:hypothetical protein